MHVFFARSILLVGCIFAAHCSAPSRSIGQSESAANAIPATFLRTKLNGGALDANGVGNAYSVRGQKFSATWKWLTLNNATPPFPWLKWRFDSSLLISGTPPDLNSGATGQVCVQCNGSSSHCDVIMAACHGGQNQRWSVRVFPWQRRSGGEAYFSIVSELEPDRCLSMAGTLTKTEWYWDLQSGPSGTKQVKKYMTLTDSGYKLEACVDSDGQSFYVEKDWNEYIQNLTK